MITIPVADFTPDKIPPVYVRINTGDTEITIYETVDELPPEPPAGPAPLPTLPWRAFFEVTGALGIDAAVETYVAGASLAVQREYHRTLSFERTNPLLMAAITAMNLDVAKVDAAWAAKAAEL